MYMYMYVCFSPLAAFVFSQPRSKSSRWRSGMRTSVTGKCLGLRMRVTQPPSVTLPSRSVLSFSLTMYVYFYIPSQPALLFFCFCLFLKFCYTNHIYVYT